MKKLLLILLCVPLIGFAQSKKKQIESLRFQLDSINYLLDETNRDFNEMKVLSAKNYEAIIKKNGVLNSKNSVLNSKNSVLNSKIDSFKVIYDETINKYKKEVSLLNTSIDSLKSLTMIGFGSISQNSILINESQVSIFKVGDKVPNVGLINEFTISMQEEECWDEEGNEYYLDVYYVLSDSDTIISIISDYYNKDIISEILIFSEKPRTKEGIGVGSTIENFTIQYNDYSIWYGYISDMCVMHTKKYNNVQFILNISDLKDGRPGFNSDMNLLEISDFFPQTKINSIRLF